MTVGYHFGYHKFFWRTSRLFILIDRLTTKASKLFFALNFAPIYKKLTIYLSQNQDLQAKITICDNKTK